MQLWNDIYGAWTYWPIMKALINISYRAFRISAAIWVRSSLLRDFFLLFSEKKEKKNPLSLTLLCAHVCKCMYNILCAYKSYLICKKRFCPCRYT